MKTIRAGVIGVGYLGRFHAQKYSAMPNVDLVGVADIETDRASAVAAECGCRPYADFRRLIREVDAVSVVVPTMHHHAVAMACLEAGIDVLVEKPITTTLAEADELISLAAAKDLVLQVGHLERFNPAVLAMQPLLTQPLFIEAHRISVFKNRGTDVDVVLDLMIHDIDIILSIVKAEIRTIHTVGAPVITPLTDIANARLIFENGCTANVTVSRISMDNIRRMRIFQPGQYLSVDFSKREVMAVTAAPESSARELIPRIDRHRFPDQDILEMELADFITNVRNRTRPMVSGREGRQALEVALEVVSQIRENQARMQHILGKGQSLAGIRIDQPLDDSD